MSTPAAEWGEEQRARSARLDSRLSSLGRSPGSLARKAPSAAPDLTGQAGSYGYMAPEASACKRRMR
jgi:hypothetical protein